MGTRPSPLVSCESTIYVCTTFIKPIIQHHELRLRVLVRQTAAAAVRRSRHLRCCAPRGTSSVPARPPHAHGGPRGDDGRAADARVERREACELHQQLRSNSSARASSGDFTEVSARRAWGGGRGDDETEQMLRRSQPGPAPGPGQQRSASLTEVPRVLVRPKSPPPPPLHTHTHSRRRRGSRARCTSASRRQIVASCPLPARRAR